MSTKLEDLKVQYRVRRTARAALGVCVGINCLWAGLALSRQDYGTLVFELAVMLVCAVGSDFNGRLADGIKKDMDRLQEIKDTFKR